MWKKVFNYFLREFQITKGRSPINRAEFNTIESQAVNWINKTKGKTLPGQLKPDWHTGFKPKVIQGGKGIEGLLKSGDVKVGVAPKTKAKTLADKKERHILFRDAEEDIARIKKENKQAVEDFKKKHGKKTVEDFTDEGDWDPYGMASGGIARVGFAEGKSYESWLNYRLKEIAAQRIPVPFKEWQKGKIKMASGGIARVALGGGSIVKGGAWVIKNLKKSRKEVIEGKGQFSKLNSMQQGLLKKELNTLIKQLEQGGAIPDEMLTTMRQDKRFKDIVKTPSTDPELRELEEVLLDHRKQELLDDWEGEAWDRGRDVVDSLTGPKEIQRRKQIETLKKFDVTGKKGHASGGIAGQLHLNRPGYAEQGFVKGDSDWGKTREEIIAEAGLDSGRSILDFVKPKAEMTKIEATPIEGIDVSERDITYGGSGIYQGDKWYTGGDYLTGNVKVDVQKEGETLFKDTMSKEDMTNLYFGLGQKEGNRIEIGKNNQGGYTLNIVKSFGKGGQELNQGGLAKVLGV